jgi:hypothetical protein
MGVGAIGKSFGSCQETARCPPYAHPQLGLQGKHGKKQDTKGKGRRIGSES